MPSDNWAMEKARELLYPHQKYCGCIDCTNQTGAHERIAAALCEARAQNPDTARLDKLEALGAEYAADEHHGAAPSFRVRSIHSLVECSRTGVHPYATLREAIDAMSKEDTPK